MKDQIEKIKEISKVIQKNGLGEHLCDAIAVGIYDAGYRKQSEVAREIFEEIEKISKAPHGYICLSYDELAELKKKYTEGET